MEEVTQSVVTICKAISQIIPADSRFQWDVVWVNGRLLIAIRNRINIIPYTWTLDNSLKTGQLVHKNLVIEEFPTFQLTMGSINDTLKSFN